MMPKYEVDYTYFIKEYGAVTLTADTIEIAEEEGMKYAEDLFDDVEVKDIEVAAIRQLGDE
jgi:hypothetical protein